MSKAQPVMSPISNNVFYTKQVINDMNNFLKQPVNNIVNIKLKSQEHDNKKKLLIIGGLAILIYIYFSTRKSGFGKRRR